MEQVAHEHGLFPAGVHQHHLVAGGMAHGRHGGNAFGNLVFALDNLLQAQAAQGHYLLLHVGILRQDFRLGVVVVIILGDDVAGAAEVGRRHPAGVAQVPAHVVGVKVGMHHVVDLVGRGDVGVVNVHVGRQHHRAQFLVEVAHDIAAAGVRSRPHAGVHQHGMIFGADDEHAVVELQLPVLQDVLVVGPGAFGNVGEHGRGRPRRRHHVNDGGNFVTAYSSSVCHETLSSCLGA